MSSDTRYSLEIVRALNMKLHTDDVHKVAAIAKIRRLVNGK